MECVPLHPPSCRMNKAISLSHFLFKNIEFNLVSSYLSKTDVACGLRTVAEQIWKRKLLIN